MAQLIRFQALLLLLFSSYVSVSSHPDCGALCDYVHSDDPNYGFEVLDIFPGNGVTTYLLNFTSQQWLDETVSSRPVWWHALAVNIPHSIQHPGRAFLHLSWYSNTDSLPNENSRHVRETARFARRTGMVSATLRHVPNQPVQMGISPIERTEDDILAWTWLQFLSSTVDKPDPEIFSYFPMCKAAKRAMDAITEFSAGISSEGEIRHFMLSGESKRGWTTWLMGVVDDRVEVIVPTVMSILNINENMHHYFRSLGGWPFAFDSYYRENMTSYIDHPRMFELEEYIDVYSRAYREALTLPKLIISGAADEFFMPDDFTYFFDDLLGVKYIWMLENTGHSIANSPLVEEFWTMLETFYLAFINDYEYPRFSWRKVVTESGGSIILHSEEKVAAISVMAAYTPEIVSPRKDFRRLVLHEGSIVESGVFWNEYEVVETEDGEYVARFDNPHEGYLAFFIKVEYTWPQKQRVFTFSTDTLIIPDIFPFDDCQGVNCKGNLV